ncbi:hypothetical protein QMG90_18820 [Trabulsiella odontotermitis]|uniref:hypothetical protein n=1 Tax=Trabulsiella odontotermitis TaxID=379893 RepID=UPI0024B7D755|nr:hypothetical protein [Trabulsiella odontotermitis]WHP30789.1 hypothetical protein QMG90_18820 [Trabulsiella odontotermitis]
MKNHTASGGEKIHNLCMNMAFQRNKIAIKAIKGEKFTIRNENERDITFLMTGHKKAPAKRQGLGKNEQTRLSV